MQRKGAVTDRKVSINHGGESEKGGSIGVQDRSTSGSTDEGSKLYNGEDDD